MAIIIEGGGREEGGGLERPSKEGEEEVEEAMEQLEEQVSASRSSSVSSWDGLHGNHVMTADVRRFSASLGQEDLKLVVKAVRVKKKRRRHTDSSSGSRLSESSCSDSMFVVQDGSCSEGGSGTPLSDRTSLIGLDLQNQDSPEQDQNLPDAGVQGAVESGSTPPPDSLILQGLQNQQNPAETVPPTPDVDLLLECTFSYMHNTDGGGQEQQPMEDHDQFLSPLIGREDEEAKVFLLHLCGRFIPIE